MVSPNAGSGCLIRFARIGVADGPRTRDSLIAEVAIQSIGPTGAGGGVSRCDPDAPALLTTWYPEGRVSVRGRVVGDGVRRLGAQPPSVAAQSDLIVPIMPFVAEEP